MKSESLANASKAAIILSIGIVAGLSYAHAEGSTFSVTGTARFGDGAMISTFPATPGATEYALRLSSGLFISSGPIRFQDGTFQFTGAVTASTLTVIPAQSFNNPSLGPCLTGSTVTLTTVGGGQIAIFLLGYAAASSGEIASFGVLLDGNSISEYENSGIIALNEYRKNAAFNIVPRLHTQPGDHTVCLQGGGVGYINAWSDDDSMNHFGAFEIR